MRHRFPGLVNGVAAALTLLLGAEAASVSAAETPTTDPTEKETQIIGRLLLSTTAPVQLSIDGVAIGDLEPDSVLVHEVHQLAGTIRAVSLDTPEARLDREYAVPELATDEERAVPEVEILLRMDKVIRELRKKQRRDGVYAIFDRSVMWRRQDNGFNLTWAAAARYCGDLSFGGWSDWRLPSLDELEELQAMWSRASFKTIDPITLSDCCPWSGSEIDAESAWNYNFRFRRAFEGRKALSYGLRALCVRDLTPLEIEERAEALAAREKKKKKKRKGQPDDEGAPVGTVEDVSGTARQDDIH